MNGLRRFRVISGGADAEDAEVADDADDAPEGAPTYPDEWHDRSCHGCGKLVPETYPAEVVTVTEFVSERHRQTHWHSNCYTLEQFKHYQMGQAIGAEILSRCTPGAQR